MKPILILWTCKDLEEGRRIAKALLEQRLIACASMIPLVESMFLWSLEIEHAKECKVFLKTIERHFDSVRSYISERCSYQVPEILQIAIEKGHAPYLDWLQKVVR